MYASGVSRCAGFCSMNELSATIASAVWFAASLPRMSSSSAATAAAAFRSSSAFSADAFTAGAAGEAAGAAVEAAAAAMGSGLTAAAALPGSAVAGAVVAAVDDAGAGALMSCAAGDVLRPLSCPLRYATIAESAKMRIVAVIMSALFSLGAAATGPEAAGTTIDPDGELAIGVAGLGVIPPATLDAIIPEPLATGTGRDAEMRADDSVSRFRRCRSVARSSAL